MKEIAYRLNTYIQSHPLNLGDSDCETVMDALVNGDLQIHLPALMLKMP